jgi:phospholipid transport system transporter-binding protein
VSQSGVNVRADGVFEIDGRMTFQTAPDLLPKSAQWLNGAAGAVTIDLGSVTLADSAGLALMLEWLEQARAAQRELTFVSLPEQMQRLVKVSGLEDVFAGKSFS